MKPDRTRPVASSKTWYVERQFLRDTERVNSVDTYMKRAVLGLSSALVLLLAGVAVFTLLSNDEPQISPDLTVGTEPEAPEVVFPGSRLQIGDNEFPLSIGCIQDRTDDEVFLVVIQNQGAAETDYLVSARLIADDGTSVDAMARADDLRPGEEREIVLLPDDDIDNPDECVIKAVQGDRRVLISGN